MIEVKYCAQYIGGGGLVVFSVDMTSRGSSGKSYPMTCELVVRCVKDYYEWRVDHSMSQIGGPQAKGVFNNTEKYRYLPEAAQRAGNLVAELLMQDDEDEHEHGPNCNH